MNKAIRSTLAAAAVAAGSLWAVQAANADTDVYFSVGAPVQSAPVYVQPAQPVYVSPAAPTVYVSPGYGYGSPWEQQRAWQEAQWRRQQWRQQEWREHEWREHERREHEWREHEWREGRHEGGGWHR
jgi:hypothetical protein